MANSVTQHTFAGGELDRDTMGRQDLEKYFTGAETIENYIVKRQGFLSKRHGTDHVANVTSMVTSDNARIIPFNFDADIGYAIIFDEETANVIADDGTTVATLNVPYTASDAKHICYRQSGDVLFLAHPSHPPAKIIRAADGTFSFKNIVFANSLHIPSIASIVSSGTAGGGAEKTVYYAVTAIKDNKESLPSIIYPFKYTLPWNANFIANITVTNPAVGLEPDYYNVYKKDSGAYFGFIGSTISNVTHLTTAPTFSASSNTPLSYNIDIAPTATLATLWSTGSRGRYGLGYESICLPAGQITATFATAIRINKLIIHLGAMQKTYEYFGETKMNYLKYYYYRSEKITALITYGDNSTETLTAFIQKSEDSEISSSTTDVDQQLFDLWIAYKAGSLPAETCEIDIQAQSGTKTIISIVITAYYKDSNGNYQTCTGSVTKYGNEIISVNNNPFFVNRIEFLQYSDTANFFQDTYITPDMTITPPTEFNGFSSVNNYPALVELYQQRLVFACTNAEPSKFWMSRIADLENFSLSEVTTESDAIEASLPLTQGPRITHLIAQRDIHMFAEASEWIVKSNNGGLSYKTINAEMQSANGSASWLDPILCGTAILFVEATGKSVREYRYDYTVDGFAGRDVSILSAHIFRDAKIIDWAYQQHPDSLIWAALEDGTLACFTYMPEHEVYAWHRHILDGAQVLSLASTLQIKAQAGSTRQTTTATYMLVKRGTAYMLERLRPDPVGMPTIAAAACLEASYVITADAESSIPEGYIAIDTATGEEVTSLETGDEYIIGRLITATVKTVNPELRGNSTLQYTIKSVQSVDITLRNTDGISVAASASNKPAQAKQLPHTIAAGKITLGTQRVNIIPYQTNSGDARIIITDDSLYGSNIMAIATNLSIEIQNGMRS